MNITCIKLACHERECVNTTGFYFDKYSHKILNTYRSKNMTIQLQYNIKCNKTRKYMLYINNKQESWKVIAKCFEETYFSHCIGALDGKHVDLQSPFLSNTTYSNYKRLFSIIVMGMCDSNYYFLLC